MPVQRGYVKIPENKAKVWLPLLRDIYRFEAPRVTGPGSYKKKFSEAIWTLESLKENIGLNDDEVINNLIDYLLKERQLMSIPNFEGQPVKYITRVGEMVRVLGHTYEYWQKGRPTISATRWLIEEKKVPELVIPARIFVDDVKNKCLEIMPLPQGTNLVRAAEEVCIAVASKFKKDWEEAKFSDFQLKSTLSIIESRYNNTSKYKAQILTAGVGSGKTIGFSIATLIEARKTMLDSLVDGPDYQNTCLFIYPRTQLAKDQFDDIKGIVEKLECDLPIWLEMYDWYDKEGMTPITTGVPKVYGENSLPKGIIVTTFETLKRRMRRPEFMKKMGKHLSMIVLDEIHLLNGIGGGMSSQLLSRLSEAVSNSNHSIHWVGASATIARPDEHGSKLFGLQRHQVQVISPTDYEMVQAGINHHIFVRPTSGMSLLGALVNTSSIVLHSRRSDLANRKVNMSDKKRQKSIGFADNLEMLGRWNDDLKENERTQHIHKAREHPEKSIEQKDWKSLQREIPYAWRFYKPLQKRLQTHGGQPQDPQTDTNFKDLRNLFPEEKCAKVCDDCKKGVKSILGEISPEDMLELNRLVYRAHHKQDDKVKKFIVDSDVFDINSPQLIGSHELCPFLEAGACFWFPEPDTSKLHDIKNTKFRDFAAVARSSVFSSKSAKKEADEDIESGITSKIFRSSQREVFDVGSQREQIPVDIVLASPSLEVGVDLPMLTESILVKSVRNIASYRQKVGRVGRERFLDTTNISLMTDSNIDLHYYRQPRKLVSQGRLEPVPLMEYNRAIIAVSAYSAVWEWLAIYSDLPEVITSTSDGSLGVRLKKCLDDIINQKSELKSYIDRSVNGYGSYDDLIESAIQQVSSEILTLTQDASTTYSIDCRGIEKTEFTVIDAFGMHRNNCDIRKKIDYNPEEYDKKKQTFIDDLEYYYSSYPDDFVEKSEFVDEFLADLKDGTDSPSDLADFRNLLSEFDIEFIDEDHEDAFDDCRKSSKRYQKEEAKRNELGFSPEVQLLIEEYKELDDKIKPYLSDSMDKLSVMIKLRKKNRYFLRPSTLFENPYTKKVTLEVKGIDSNYTPTPLEFNQSEISLSEAIFSMLPGTWNHRIPHRRLKVRTGLLESANDLVISRIDKMVNAGNKFSQITNSQLPPPPGISEKMHIFSPKHLVLIESKDKYVNLNQNSMQVMDKDEALFEHPSNIRTKVPKSFQNRWAWSEKKTGCEVGVFNLNDYEFKIEGKEDTNPDDVLHPLRESIIRSIEWHDNREIIEYTYCISRSFGGHGQSTLAYRDKNDRQIGFGEKFTTNAISIQLDASTVAEVKEKVFADMQSKNNNTSPSILKAFKAFVLDEPKIGVTTISPYSIDDLISCLLVHSKWKNHNIDPETLISFVSWAVEDNREFSVVVENYVRKKMKLDQKYDPENPEKFEPDKMVNSRVRSIQVALKVISEVSHKFLEFLPIWIHRTIISTFGVVATNSMQQFTGCSDGEVAYLIEEDSWHAKDTKILLYDRADFGNGSVATARDYMHIPHVVRTTKAAREIKLPTTDYLSTLEENLLQCVQHQSDIAALCLIDGKESEITSSMPDLVKQAKEIYEVSKSSWKKLEIRGMDDAWTLPIHKRLASHYEGEDSLGIPMDDVLRSCTSCWTGCPECVDQMQNALGGFIGLNYIDKFILDNWFNSGVQNSSDYQYLNFEEMSSSNAEIHLGSLNKLLVQSKDKSEIKRSICLPWTMGFHIQRVKPFRTNLLIRTSDVSGLRIGLQSGAALGIESHGFERLLWFDLLMTAHLDAVGVLPEEKKYIQICYYDARDIQMKDIGLTPRMLDSMLAVSNKTNISSLSGILKWMVSRGFKIDICVDAGQATQIPVRSFLEKFRYDSNVKILEKDIKRGSMHKKILITPIAALTGTANLTLSGSQNNDESIVHITSNNHSEFDSQKANARTTFSSASPFDFDRPLRSRRSRDVSPTEPSPNLSEIDRVVNQISEGNFVDEGLTLECKSCYSVPNPERKITEKDTVDVVFREVASMLNTEGGTLVVGIEDGTWIPLGINQEIQNSGGSDKFKNKVASHFKSRFGTGLGQHVNWDIRELNGKQILVITVKKVDSRPIWFKPNGERFKKYSISNYGCLFTRISDNVEALKLEDFTSWSKNKFGIVVLD